MQDEDDAALRRPPKLIPPPLGPMGVAELAAYIEELRAEIARVEADSARKQDHRAAADAFFRPPVNRET